MRVTRISCANVTSHSSTPPDTGAAELASGVAASGMCPSPASRPDVGSSPTQPAPGRYTSVQACRSVKSVSGPAGPSSDFTSGFSWIRYPETNRAASPRWRRISTSSQAVSRHEPLRERQRLFARLHARLHADQVADLVLQPLVEVDQEIHRPPLACDRRS